MGSSNKKVPPPVPTPIMKKTRIYFLRSSIDGIASPVCGPCRVKDINKLEMLQRRAARFAKSDLRRATTSIPTVDLGWKTLSERRKDARLNLFGKVAISVGDISRPTQTTH